jgi:hypothetical protein
MPGSPGCRLRCPVGSIVDTYWITAQGHGPPAGLNAEALKRHTDAIGEAIHAGEVSNNSISDEYVTLGEPDLIAAIASRTGHFPRWRGELFVADGHGTLSIDQPRAGLIQDRGLRRLGERR